MKYNCLSEIEQVLVYNSYTHFIDCKELRDLDSEDQVYIGGNNFAYITSINKSNDYVMKITLMHGRAIYATLDHVFPLADGTFKEVRNLSPGDELKKHTDWDLEIIDNLDVVKLLINNYMDQDVSIRGSIIEDICKEHESEEYYFAEDEATVALYEIKKWIFDYDYSECTITTGLDYNIFKTNYPITESLMTLLGYYLSVGFGNRYIIPSKNKKALESIERGLEENFPSFKYEKITVEGDTHLFLDDTSLHSILFDFIFGCKTLENRRRFPEFIFNISYDMKKAFLKGFLASGSLNVKREKGAHCEIVFNAVGLKLYSDLCMLLNTMDVNYSVTANWNDSLNTPARRMPVNARSEIAKVTIEDPDDFEKVADIIVDHADYEEVKKDLEKYPLKKKKEYDHRYIINSVEKMKEKVSVVDINIDTEDKIFITSHGILSHNCEGKYDVID